MIKNYPAFKILVPLFFLLFSIVTFSQIVTVINVNPNPVCAGTSVNVTFSATNGNGNGNRYDKDSEYKIFLSTATGYVQIGSTFTASNASSITYNTADGGTTYGLTTTVTIPSTTFAGSNYKLTITGKINNNPNWIFGTDPSPIFTIETPPVAPTSVAATATTICSGSSTTLSYIGGSGTTFRWLTGSCTGTSVGSVNNLVVSPTTTTTYYGRWENSCGNSTCQAVTVTVNPLPTAPTGTASQFFCSGASPTVAHLVATGTAIKWYAASSGGTALATTVALVNGTHYYASQTVSGCESAGRFDVTATVNTSPAAPGPIEVTEAQCPTFTNKVYSILSTGATTYNWTVPSGWSITSGWGTTSITVNIGSAGQDGNITVSAQNLCASEVQTLAVTGKTINYWNGSDNSVWNNATNWSNGVPSGLNNLDIVIPVVPSGKYPLLSDDISINNIEIQNDALLNVFNNGLTITGVLILNGKIDLQVESQLIQEMTSSLIICNNSLGSIEIDQQGTGDSFNYNYWSSPVNSNITAKTYSIGGVLRDGADAVPKLIDFGAAHTWADGAATPAFIKLSTYWMYKLEDSKGYAAWTRIRDNISIKVGEGYTMKGSNTTDLMQNYTFVGKPNNGTIELDVNEGNEYLVGNPYPSAIDAEQFLIDNGPTGTDIIGVGSALHFWEHSGGGTHNLAGYQGGYATYNLSGGASAASGGQVAGVGTFVNAKKIPRRYIPVGQAFFVVGDHAGKIRFKNSQRIFVKESQVYKDIDNNDVPFSVFMKSSNTKSKTDNTNLSDLRPKFRIGYDAPKISHRQLLLTVDERATKEVDWGFDAEIFEIFADDFYWMLDGKKYIIQGTNNVGLNSEVPLGIQLSKTGLVTVKIDALENVDDDTSIYLKDKVTGESFNMQEKPVELNLIAGKYADRFVLVFKTQKLVAEDVKAELLIPAAAQPIIEGIHVFMNNAIGELQIKNNSSEEITSVALINALGQTIKTWNSNFNIRTISLPINTATGIYLVQINTNTSKTVKKISVE